MCCVFILLQRPPGAWGRSCSREWAPRTDMAQAEADGYFWLLICRLPLFFLPLSPAQPLRLYSSSPDFPTIWWGSAPTDSGYSTIYSKEVSVPTEATNPGPAILAARLWSLMLPVAKSCLPSRGSCDDVINSMDMSLSKL